MKLNRHRVLIEPIEENTDALIITPENIKEKPQRGKVAHVGIGTKEEPMQCKVGDIVLFPKGSGSEITIDGKDYLLMHDAEIIGWP